MDTLFNLLLGVIIGVLPTEKLYSPEPPVVQEQEAPAINQECTPGDIE